MNKQEQVSELLKADLRSERDFRLHFDKKISERLKALEDYLKISFIESQTILFPGHYEKKGK